MHEALPAMTEAEYLAWEDRQDVRHEFDGVRPVAMTGEAADHALIRTNLHRALGMALHATSCIALGPTMRLATGQGRYRYPDAMVSCADGPPTGGDVTEPIVLFEVVSDRTGTTDWTEKLVEYRSIPSLARYVMLEVANPIAVVITRVTGQWRIDALQPGAAIPLSDIGLSLPVNALYDGLAGCTA